MRPVAAVTKLLFLIAIIAMLSGEAWPYSSDSPRSNLRWKPNLIMVSISDSLSARNSSIKYGSDVSGAISRSLGTWENVADVSFRRSDTKNQSVSPAGKSGDGVNLITIAQTPENVLLFARGADDASAKTRVFYDRSGFITEADIVLNPFLQFSTDGTAGTVDLEATLIHEVGHLLGLDHSPVLGSTMYESYGRNGAAGATARGLTEQDIAAVRALYGARDDDSCCGEIDGTLTLVSGRGTSGLFVWAEDKDSGRVMAEAPVNAVGQFNLGGLSEGTYRVYAQSIGHNEKSSAVRLGDVEVEKFDVKTLNRRVRFGTPGFDLQYLGVNGAISALAVPVEPGRVSLLFLGGKGIDEKSVKIASDSPFISIVPGTTSTQDYGNDLKVISVEIKIDEAALPGEYSVFGESEGGLRRFLVGSLVVGRRNF
ncbi:MAG TPA: matrixin family metalloprotease [Pyrinomonadaceae bacterium]|nr:matrixin family metalloprotease [Pyrinomonadaceae bacterium]